MSDRNIISIAWDWVKPSGWDFATYTGDAQAPILYKYDSSGFISPAANRNVTIQDGTMINEYNQRVATRLQEQDSTLNQFLRQSMPNWQPANNDLGVLANPNANYSNEGRNYQSPSYNFGPNYRGNGFTDPRILDNSEGYRGMNTYSGVYASQAAENAAFEQDWNTALNAYSMEPSYTSFPTDPAAYNGYSDAFGDNSSSSNTDTSGWYDAGGYDNSGGYDAGGYDYGGYDDYYDYSYDSYDYGGGDWYPLVIDLDGDGVEIKTLDRSTTTFDIDSDGYKERTAWVGADDGMLVIDLNGDNQITQSKEMAFGEWTSEQDTDLQALAKVFDSNGDGTFDSRDARFNEFRIWKDTNSNGVADAGEMMTLQAAGIASIATTVKDGTALDLSDGTSIAGLFKVQRTDGRLVDGADVAFAYQKTGVKETVDAQGNKVFTFEDGGVYKHMVMNSTQTDVTLPDTSGINWIGVTGNAANDALYRRCA